MNRERIFGTSALVSAVSSVLLLVACTSGSSSSSKGNRNIGLSMQLPKIPGVASLASGTMVNFAITLRVTGANGFIFSKEIVAGEEVALEVPSGPLSFTAGYMGVLLPPDVPASEFCTKMKRVDDGQSYSLGGGGDGPSIFYAKAEKTVEPPSGGVVALSFGTAAPMQMAMFGVQVFNAPNAPAGGSYLRFADPNTEVGFAGPCPGQEFRKRIPADGKVSADFHAISNALGFVIEGPSGRRYFRGGVSLTEQGRNIFAANLFEPGIDLKPLPGTGDFDNDGVSNERELAERTNPFDDTTISADKIGCWMWDGKFTCGIRDMDNSEITYMDNSEITCKFDGTPYPCGGGFCLNSGTAGQCGVPSIGSHTLEVGGSDRFGFLFPTIVQTVTWMSTPVVKQKYPMGQNVDPTNRIYVRMNREVTSGRFEIARTDGVAAPLVNCTGMPGVYEEKSSLVCNVPGGLSSNAQYSVTVKELLLSGGVSFTEPVAWTFKTRVEDNVPSQVSQFYPNSNEGLPGRDPDFSIEFSRPMKASSVNELNAISVTTDDGIAVSKNCFYRDEACEDHWHYKFECSITSGLENGILPAGKRYIVDLNSSASGVRDAKDMPLLSPVTRFSFVSGGVPGVIDTVPPTVSRKFPIAGALNARADTLVAVFFSEPINTRETWNSFAVTGSDNVPISMDWCETWESRALVCKPKNPLAVGATYTVQAVNVRDLYGNMMGSSTWTFKVGTPASTQRVALFHVPDVNEVPESLYPMKVSVFYNNALDYSATKSAATTSALIAANPEYFAVSETTSTDFYAKGYNIDLKNYVLSRRILVDGLATPTPAPTVSPRPSLTAVVPNPTPGSFSWDIGGIQEVQTRIVSRLPAPNSLVSSLADLIIGFNKPVVYSTTGVEISVKKVIDGTVQETEMVTDPCDQVSVGGTQSSYLLGCYTTGLEAASRYRVVVRLSGAVFETWEFSTASVNPVAHAVSVSPQSGTMPMNLCAATIGSSTGSMAIDVIVSDDEASVPRPEITYYPLGESTSASCTLDEDSGWDGADGSGSRRFSCSGVPANALLKAHIPSSSGSTDSLGFAGHTWVFKTGTVNMTCGYTTSTPTPSPTGTPVPTPTPLANPYVHESFGQWQLIEQTNHAYVVKNVDSGNEFQIYDVDNIPLNLANGWYGQTVWAAETIGGVNKVAFLMTPNALSVHIWNCNSMWKKVSSEDMARSLAEPLFFPTGGGGGTVQPPTVTYPNSNVMGIVGQSMNIQPTIVDNGSSLTSCTITPALPSGLVFHNTLCEISGTPSSVVPPVNYTVAATNAGGTGIAVVTIGIITLPVAPTILVPRIATGGVDTAENASDVSGLPGPISQPAAFCGTAGAVEERIADCKAKNPVTSGVVDVAIPPKYWWQLVSNGGIGKVLWRDNLTGLIWSDVVSMAGWCHASGSNNKLNSPLAEADTFSYCNSEANQSQTAPVSLCAELPELVTPPESSSAKGGLAATWWLPGIEDLRTVYAHGAKSVLPEFSSGEWWSSSIYTSDRGTAGRLSGVDGSVINPYRYGVNKVRCVGVQ